nr:MAG TPA: hypothetical protein [Caudoviricetes sp.]
MIYFVILGATIIDYILIQDLHVPSTFALQYLVNGYIHIAS